jgi:hypothetical protein
MSISGNFSSWDNSRDLRLGVVSSAFNPQLLFYYDEYSVCDIKLA